LHRGRLVAVEAARRWARLSGGEEIPYDMLVVCLGARLRGGLEGGFSFTGPAETVAFRRLVEELADRGRGRLVFCVPTLPAWPLPLYELALLTAASLSARAAPGVEITLVTPEPAALALFGSVASETVSTLLSQLGIELVVGRHAVRFAQGELELRPDGRLAADAVVTLPRLVGPRLVGLPHDRHGFIPTDLHGRVRGMSDVFAAGDATSFPVKQGGIAAQQADAVAEAIAAHLGAVAQPTPFRPVLRGLLLTGSLPRYLRRELTGGAGDTAEATTTMLWWPPSKIVGRYLAPYLAAFSGRSAWEPPAGLTPLAVEAALDEPSD
jgi:sulfide:quinone oxidoreductase